MKLHRKHSNYTLTIADSNYTTLWSRENYRHSKKEQTWGFGRMEGKMNRWST
jgi:hypothetical protein